VTIPLKRKVRKTGESLAITLPSQIAELHNIHEGDYVAFTIIGTGEFRIKKAERRRKGR
jgi:antitoxin component of MazEF toxin-antitoxin module